ncbi:MAG: hypothetical protein MI924_16305, partial [Chloroflexales bacterium]|nr:hypothetical protein [Chloroflexales bacterium]
ILPLRKSFFVANDTLRGRGIVAMLDLFLYEKLVAVRQKELRNALREQRQYALAAPKWSRLLVRRAMKRVGLVLISLGALLLTDNDRVDVALRLPVYHPSQRPNSHN